MQNTGRCGPRADLLRDELAAVAEVHQVAFFDSQKDATEAPPDVLNSLRRGEVDYITVTSSNIARSLANLLDEETKSRIISGELKVVSISPVTNAAVASWAGRSLPRQPTHHRRRCRVVDLVGQ